MGEDKDGKLLAVFPLQTLKHFPDVQALDLAIRHNRIQAKLDRAHLKTTSFF